MTKPRIRLVIGIPTSGMVPAGFTSSCMALVKSLAEQGIPSRKEADFDYAPVWCESASWISNRYEIVKGAIAQDATHLLFLDDDMVFLPQAVDLLFSRRHPIVVTNYLIKTEPPRDFVAVGLDGERVVTTSKSTGIEPILYSGFGLSLFDLEVFRKTAEPWFLPEFVADRRIITTEDNPCFRRFREAGFPVYLDHDATKFIVGHSGRKGWNWTQWAGPAPKTDPTKCATNGRVPQSEVVSHG